MDIATFAYLVLAFIAVFGSVAVVLSRDTVRSAMALVGVMLSLAGLFLLMHQEFIAAIQVIVYAGAIMVLFLFVIMLLNMREKERLPWHLRRVRFWGGVVSIAFFFLVGVGAYILWPEAETAKAVVGPRFTVADIAQVLLSDYLLAFELTSILLLVAIIGAVVMARRLPEELKQLPRPGQNSTQDDLS